MLVGEEKLNEISKKLKALDNPIKLKILHFLIEEGAKSITDISRELNLNFSTAHKYLEQLESAKLVTSKQVTDNRLKRLFFVKDFNIDLSPTGIANLLSAAQKRKRAKTFKVINEAGEIVDFDEKLFSRKYLKRGLPRGIISYALSSVLEQAYDGITLVEMRNLFQEALENREKCIDEILKQLTEGKRERSFAQLLQLISPKALKLHANGDIFIRNLQEPILFNFAHDLQSIITHGVNGKQPKNLNELFQFVLGLIKELSFLRFSQGFASFNYHIAPLTKNLNNKEIEKSLRWFFDKLEELGNKFYINLDYGKPRFLKGTSSLQETAKKICQISLQIIKSRKYKRVKPVLKIWNKNLDEKLISGFKEIYLANMLPKWQTVNATYIGTHRFDGKWKKEREARIGTLQTITINLPRIAITSKSKKEFFNKLNEVISESVLYLTDMVELILGKFFKSYKTTFLSVMKGRWSYIHYTDCAYHVALTGLNEAVKILTNKELSNNENFGKKIIEFCNNIIKERTKLPIRIELKEATNKPITKRFHTLDSKMFNIKLNKYSTGVSCKNFKTSAKLHKFFCGGHCVEIKKAEINDFIKNDGGLALIKE